MGQDEKDIVNNVNEKVIALWGEWSKKLDDNNLKMPLVYPEIDKDRLLFIGMNPSFVPEEYDKNLPKKYYSTDIIRFFAWSNHDDFDMAKCRNIEKIMREKYVKYFGKFREIAQETVGDPSKFEHIDLFFNRETSQKEFKKKILNNTELKEFVRCQLELSKSLIRYAHPKVIVVANAGAAKLFEENLGEEFHLKWNEEQGHHTAVVNEKPVPVFLTSMLTGQRALDDGSFQRLKWQIKKAIKETANESG